MSRVRSVLSALPLLTGLLYAGLLVWGILLAVGIGWDDLHRGLLQFSFRLRGWAARLEKKVAPPPPTAVSPSWRSRPTTETAVPPPKIG